MERLRIDDPASRSGAEDATGPDGDFTRATDPWALFAAWMAEAEASEPNDPNAMALATTGSDGLPDVRVVLLKGVDAHGFVFAKVGQRAVFTNASRNISYSGLVGQGGALTDLKQVADRGGESVALGPDGKVYVANGQVFVYGADGKESGRIDVPARPLQLIFGGPDRKTLYILTHHALYSTRI